MYSRQYRTQTHHKIDASISEKFIQAAKNTIEKMSQPDQINFHFAIMEIEAWFLGMYTLFAKIDPRLTISFAPGDKFAV